MLFTPPSSTEATERRRASTTSFLTPAARQRADQLAQQSLFPTPSHLLPTYVDNELKRSAEVTKLTKKTVQLVHEKSTVPPTEVSSMVWLTPKGSAITSSRNVAACFGKEHKHVLRDIRNLQATLAEVQDDEAGLYFADHGYRDEQNQLRPEIVMTERGFMLLAMGFTGAEAMRYKLSFLDAFERLVKQAAARSEAIAPQFTPEPAITRLAQLAYYTRQEMQVECVKQVATHVMLNAAGGKGTLIKHHRSVMVMLTGMRPSEYRKHLEDANEKLRIKSKSGRQLLREYDPAKAAAAAVLDDAVRLGTPIEQLQESNAMLTLPAAFESILALGLMPADLT